MDTNAILAAIRAELDWEENNPVSERHEWLAGMVRELDGLLTCGDPIPTEWRFSE